MSTFLYSKLSLALALTFTSAVVGATTFNAQITGNETTYQNAGIRTCDKTGTTCTYIFGTEDNYLSTNTTQTGIKITETSVPEKLILNNYRGSSTTGGTAVDISHKNKSLVFSNAEFSVTGGNYGGYGLIFSGEDQNKSGGTVALNGNTSFDISVINNTPEDEYVGGTAIYIDGDNAASNTHLTGENVNITIENSCEGNSADTPAIWISGTGANLAFQTLAINNKSTVKGNEFENINAGLLSIDGASNFSAQNFNITSTTENDGDVYIWQRGIFVRVGNTVNLGSGIIDVKSTINGTTQGEIQGIAINDKNTSATIDNGQIKINVEGNASDVAVHGIAAFGGTASLKAGSIDLTLKDKNKGLTAVGVLAGGNSTMNIGSNGHNVNISITSDSDIYKSYGIKAEQNSQVNYFGGSVGSKNVGIHGSGNASINLFGNTTINGDAMGIAIEEHSILNINEGANVTSNSSKIESTVNVNKATFSTGKLHNQLETGNWKITSSTVNFGEFANGSKTRSLGSIDAEDSVLNFENSADNFYKIQHLSGNNSVLHLNSLAPATIRIETDKSTNLLIDVPTDISAPYATVEDYARAIAGTVTNEGTGDYAADKIQAVQGDLFGAFTGSIKNGKLVELNIQKNNKIEAAQVVQSLAVYQWRHDMNDLTKRMGELRTSSEGVGLWARAYGSEQEYAARHAKAENSTLQIGLDTDIGNGWKLGGALSYTDGDVDYALGSADSESYSIAAYGTWMQDNGQFFDVIAKYGRLKNDFTIDQMDGELDNNAFSFSAEAGWNILLNDRIFVEPQFEMSYGRVDGDNYTIHNGVRVAQDDFKSLIGRLGVRGGMTLPNNMGNLYARVSVLHDLDGMMESVASKGVQSTVMQDDFGGTWVEYGIGANFNINEQAYAYVDVERSSEGEIEENWRWNVGMRYTF